MGDKKMSRMDEIKTRILLKASKLGNTKVAKAILDEGTDIEC
jgi:hypothetical protein